MMQAHDRRAQGYEPRWDVALDAGAQAEMWVCDVIEGLKSQAVEVKQDAGFIRTGNIFVEEQRWDKRQNCWKPSGLTTTHASIWVYRLKGFPVGLIFETSALREFGRTPALAREAHTPMDWQHPAAGFLLNLPTLFGGRGRGAIL